MVTRPAIISALLIAAIVTVGLLRAPAAQANAGPHGGYTLLTNACGGCHRAHTAAGSDLLATGDEFALCTTCHGGLTETDVLHGRRTWDGARLNGGGFLTLGATPVTSNHTVQGLAGGSGEGTAWGGASSGAGVAGVLKCTSCHNPHGSSNYRILRDASSSALEDGLAAPRWVAEDPDLLDWVDQQVQSTVDDNHDYATSPVYARGGAGAYYTTGMTYDPANGTVTSDPVKGMSAFCSTCHKSYLTKSGSARHASTDPAYYVYPGTQDIQDGAGDRARHRHALGWVWTHEWSGWSDQACLSCHYDYGPMVEPDISVRFAASSRPGEDPVALPHYDGVTCLTCHFAHGSGAAAVGDATSVAPAGDSALLYRDNRGVCQTCHYRSGAVPTLTPTP